MNENVQREDRLIGRNAVSIRVRWLGLAGFLSLAVGTYVWQAMPAQIVPLVLICALFAAENLIYDAHLHYVRARGRLPFSKTFTEWQSLPDFALLAAVVHFSGGVDSPYLYLSLLSLLMSGSLIQQPGVVLALATISTSLTSLVVLAELGGIIPYYPFAPGAVLEPYAPAGYVALSLGVYAVMMFVTAFGMVFLSQLLRRRSLELHESEERYRDLVENIGDLVFTVDTEGRLTFVNHTVEARTGYAAKELLGQPVGAFLAPESLGAFQEAVDRGFGKGLPVRSLRVVGLTRDGQRFHLEVNMSRIRRHRRMVGARGVARDITDRKQLEDELSQRLSDIASLYQASAQISASLSVEETLQEVVRQAVAVTHGVWASVILVDSQGRPELYTAVGDAPNLPPNQAMRPNGVSAQVIASREPAIFPSTREAADRLNPMIPIIEDRAAICLPLLEKNHAMGAMWVNYGQPRQFSANDVQLLRTFADQIASAIRNARLYAREQHRGTRGGLLVGPGHAAGAYRDHAQPGSGLPLRCHPACGWAGRRTGGTGERLQLYHRHAGHVPAAGGHRTGRPGRARRRDGHGGRCPRQPQLSALLPGDPVRAGYSVEVRRYGAGGHGHANRPAPCLPT
jgi:PAS domain S-box-containing protein